VGSVTIDACVSCVNVTRGQSEIMVQSSTMFAKTR